MAQRITIDPITRLEGHGKIEIFLDQAGNVKRAFFQVPELRGFEKFCERRPSEEMPRITPRICGVCPTAHHLASTKAVDDLWKVEPPRAAKRRALSRAMRVSRPARTRAVFSLRPVRVRAFSMRASSRMRVVLICISMHNFYAGGKGGNRVRLWRPEQGKAAVTAHSRSQGKAAVGGWA